MKKKRLLFSLISGVCLLLAVTAAPLLGDYAEAAQAKSMKPMKLLANGGSYPARFPDNLVLTYFCKEVEKKTNGLITFEYAWSGSLTKRGEEFRSLKGGLCNVSTVSYSFFPAQLYLNNLCRSVPFVSTDVDVQSTILKQLYDKVPALSAEWEKQGGKLLVGNVSNSFELQSRMPIVKLDDFKGKKIVISGVRAKKWFKAIGATPVTVPLPERALAFQTGMIDGSVLPFAVTKPFGLHEYAKHATSLSLGAWLACGVAINKNLFDSFPKDVQQIILEAAESARKYNIDVRKTKNAATIEALKKAGVQLHDLPVQERSRWMGLMGNQPMDWIEQGEKRGLPAGEVMKTYLSLIRQSGYKFPKEWQ